MSKIMDRSKELRKDQAVHYNCAQAVLVPFAEKKGLSAEQARGIAANFGSGMRIGQVCGAITGGLMVLGLYGAGQEADSREFLTRMKDLHEGRIQCKDLLANEVHGKEQKKPHCDNMVFEAVEIVEDMLQARGLL
jgi:C_GCAxxG_C_C family probable redox protein